ncbi:exopolysaccharide biosynthesis polyprenyl glycosylphosphotransferase [Devosia ginsengisoli]|uniref:Exopolysaccharide biosynthesis polyprenyl glycosylphosphotransferase n=2 Tax=Devosia ginsengisoli TaxID=400770 RepID=A0A5B8LYK6_9HYPH|nr:exopolysaccharide biosynthesis polyprenyl glycosylphosphotransferase [Devosia ginsengisoli]
MKLLQEPLSLARSATRDAQMTAKRVFDVIFSVLALLFLLPLLIIVAIAVRMESKGPVLFRQTREGLNGSTFGVFKFRSMRREQGDATGVAHTVRNDERVTRVGTFLRRTSIDELPQLLNVLRGEMSIVGPRPHVPGMRAGNHTYRVLVPYYDHRLAMLPGITGWAQANGLRGDATDAALAHARIDHDLAYIQNFSLWLDLRIILRTIRHEFLGGTGN